MVKSLVLKLPLALAAAAEPATVITPAEIVLLPVTVSVPATALALFDTMIAPELCVKVPSMVSPDAEALFDKVRVPLPVMLKLPATPKVTPEAIAHVVLAPPTNSRLLY